MRLVDTSPAEAEREGIEKYERNYEHDCQVCNFLGAYKAVEEETGSWSDGTHSWVDLYLHNGRFGIDLVWRYSSEPSDYGSMDLKYCLLRDSKNEDGTSSGFQESVRKIFDCGVSNAENGDIYSVDVSILVNRKYSF